MPARRTPKVEALVVNAIRRLQDVQGSTSREISNYISQEYDLPRKEIRRQVQLALQRGLAYGILQKSTSGYYSCNRDYLGQLSLGDGTGDGVMEPCPWRRRRFGRRGRRRSRSRRRRRQRRGKVRARQRRGRSRRRQRRRRSRRRRRRRDGRRRRRNGERTRTRADPDEIETEAMVSESKENNASRDDAQRKSETSISELSGETRLQDSPQDSPQDSESLNTSGDV
ncbi:probable ATP-dependent RNA helicase DDX46 [Formica exsecta]|uniref:probable ATP-dependent RNA helicase DDX46 n=1 Tax=Formica exsecta TaxID=72781 RepID=UPI0011443E7D|nr:probable ATP-dependent RNA helicase DDX46 [Formica exsecta]